MGPLQLVFMIAVDILFCALYIVENSGFYSNSAVWYAAAACPLRFAGPCLGSRAAAPRAGPAFR